MLKLTAEPGRSQGSLIIRCGVCTELLTEMFPSSEGDTQSEGDFDFDELENHNDCEVEDEE